MKLNENMEQLKALVTRPSELQVAVYGKYNHGKSSLLNALIGEEFFKTADIRETVKLKSYTKKNVTWVDTPGLDADVAQKDDHLANELLTTSDLLLFVHSVNEGELDSKEVTFLKEQYKNKRNITLVLTQIDKTETLHSVQSVIEKQLEFMTQPIEIIAVSSKRASHANEKIREKSHINLLLNTIDANKNKMLELREEEKAILKNKIQSKIEKRLSELNESKQNLLTEVYELENEFLKDVENVKNYKVAYKGIPFKSLIGHSTFSSHGF